MSENNGIKSNGDKPVEEKPLVFHTGDSEKRFLKGTGAGDILGPANIILRGILRGMSLTMRHVFRPAITVQYPKERKEMWPRFRGALQLQGMMGVEDPKPDPNPWYPPCTMGCPSHVNARGQNLLAARGDYEGAHELVRDRNILPGVLGRICHHPCEGLCRRGYYDAPISIRNLHRYCSDYYMKSERRKQLSSLVNKEEKVVIIGAGPAGLAAAYDLVKEGYKVVMYDRHPVAGGMLVAGIPKYRLPKDIVLNEVDDLKALGVEINCGVEIGKDITIQDIQASGAKAIIMALGLQNSRSIPVPGVDFEGVTTAVPFLEAANFNRDTGIGKRVLVIGGGNVAVDVALTARRLGSEVRLVSLESASEMPAHSWEVDQAREEGVIIDNCWGPTEILGENGKVSAVRFKACLAVFDENRRFAPKFDENKISDFNCDTVILAIGQAAKLSFLDGTDIQVNERGILVVDPETMQTTVPNVFAAGEVVTGPGSCIGSMANGHRTAQAVLNFLQGKDTKVQPDERERHYGNSTAFNPRPEVDGADNYLVTGHIMPEQPHNIRIGSYRPMAQVDRRHMPMMGPEERVKSFAEVELGWDEDTALTEAWRCLGCENKKCVGCGICAQSCPANAIQVTTTQHKKERVIEGWKYYVDRCIYCGICSEACPTKTLVHSGEYELSVQNYDDFYYDKEHMLRQKELPRKLYYR